MKLIVRAGLLVWASIIVVAVAHEAAWVLTQFFPSVCP